MTLNNVIKEFQAIATNHRQINSFGFGDVWEIATSGSINYPMMWVSLENSSINNKVETLKFNFIFMDIVKNGEVNENEVLSDQLEIAKDVIAQLQHKDYKWEFAGNGVSLEDFTERFVDSVSGFTCTISLNLPYSANRCQIPFVVNPDISTERGYVIIYDTDGVTQIGTASNNGFYVVTSSGSSAGTINVYLDGSLQSTTDVDDLNNTTVNIIWN